MWMRVRKKPSRISGGRRVGELALLTGEPQAFSAIADTPCEFLTLSKTNFDLILEKHPLWGFIFACAV